MELFTDNPFPTTKRESSENKTRQSLTELRDRKKENTDGII